jgi:hypothetical protein
LGALAAPSAQAKYVAIFRQVGPECRRDRQGSLDVTDLPVPVCGTYQITQSLRLFLDFLCRALRALSSINFPEL